jgi:DNA-binding MarR family transcriptional regulator
MTRTSEASAAPADSAAPAVVAVADSFVTLVRNFMRARAQMMAAAADDVEWTAHLILKHLASEGPMRSSAVADHLRADPSTVSRQVAALVRDGLIEREADPDDGRACLLVPTEAAAEILARHEQLQREYFTSMLAGWSERDLNRFAELLQRFTADYQAASAAFLAERVPGRRRTAEGTTE